jgi:hypothetical protein
MLICVDGTGTGEGTTGDLLFGTKNRTASFALEKAGSFVGMIYYGSHIPNRKYYQGPDLTGMGPNFVWPQTVCEQIAQFWGQGDHKIFLTGYSRGAAIVINTAAMLTDRPMPDGTYASVEAMFLFDAVARSADIGRAQVIPSNVRFCYHAIRDDHAHSRWTFGHCGQTMAGANTFLVKRNFYTTHGGMGGTPWGEKGLPDFSNDKLSRTEQAARAQRIDQRYFRGGPKLDGSDLNSWVVSNECIYEFPDGATNVTLGQEQVGSDAVHAWMWPFLHKHHLM